MHLESLLILLSLDSELQLETQPTLVMEVSISQLVPQASMVGKSIPTIQIITRLTIQ